MKVGILTMFNGLASIYSLVNVVADHIRMLLDGGEEVILFVCEDMPDNEKSGVYLDPRITWVKVCNRYKGKQINWRDYSNPNIPVHKDFMKEATEIGKDLTKKLKDLDVCIMHDIHYQGWHLVHNVAVRYAVDRLPYLRFIAVTHSLPDESQVDVQVPWPHSARYSPMKNTIYTYPTESGLPSLSRQYHVEPDRCRVLNNSLNLIGHMHPQVIDLHEKIDLLSPDILIVYPARFTRGKHFEKVAMMAGAIQTVSSYRVKVIFCEFTAIDTDADEYKQRIKRAGIHSGIDPENIIFVSDLGYSLGITREAVLNLFSLSNLFICPSMSESFGLTALEASAMGNYLVLNEAVPALKEVGDILGAYYMRWNARNFGYDTYETYHPSEKEYYEENARLIVGEIEKNGILQAKKTVRQRYSPKWVYENQLKKLLNIQL